MTDLQTFIEYLLWRNPLWSLGGRAALPFLLMILLLIATFVALWRQATLRLVTILGATAALMLSIGIELVVERTFILNLGLLVLATAGMLVLAGLAARDKAAGAFVFFLTLAAAGLTLSAQLTAGYFTYGSVYHGIWTKVELYALGATFLGLVALMIVGIVKLITRRAQIRKSISNRLGRQRNVPAANVM